MNISIDKKLLAELTQSLNDAQVLLEDNYRITNTNPDAGSTKRREILARVRRWYFGEFNNRPIGCCDCENQVGLGRCVVCDKLIG